MTTDLPLVRSPLLRRRGNDVVRRLLLPDDVVPVRSVDSVCKSLFGECHFVVVIVIIIVICLFACLFVVFTLC